MKIDSKLNLVVPVDTEEGEETTIYFHHTLILKDTFVRYHFAMAAALNKLLSNNMQVMGPKIAAFTLEEIAKELGQWEDNHDRKFIGIENGLMAEIKRLTNVITYTPQGWMPMPVADAISRKLLDEEDWQEASQRIVFFTLISNMVPKMVRATLLEIMHESWNTQSVLLNCTAWANSLPMLSDAGIISPRVEASPIPC
jgi:hypothetical protein